MSKEKKSGEKKPANNLSKSIKKIVRGLSYTSETDAEIETFNGTKAEAVTKEALLAQTSSAADSQVEERSFDEFFARLTKIEDWFGDEEKKAAEKFSELEELLKKELRDLKVFKVGKIELDIYVVGLDSENNLSGIKTKAVET